MIIGHQRQIKYLSRVLAKGAVAHAYLFSGPEAVGKTTLAVELAKALLCPVEPMRLGGCQVCRACRDTQELEHPDFIFLAPDHLLVPEEEKKGIGIRNIRELSRRLALRPWAGGWRVLLIDEAETMSREAQSALLKILEEPGEKTLFILSSTSPGALAETIGSRCVPVRFALVGDAELREGISRSVSIFKYLNIAEVAALARGRPGLAIRISGQKEFFRERLEAEAGFRQLLGGELDQQFLFSEAVAGGGNGLKDFLEFTLHTLGRRLESEPQVSSGLMRLLEAAARSYVLLESTSVNRRLLADAFFIELAAARDNTNTGIHTNGRNGRPQFAG